MDIDLDGNGRDEVVAAYKMGDGSLRLAVYKRGTGNVQLSDTWSLSQTFSQVELAAGDLNGSTDGRQELGVMLRSISGSIGFSCCRAMPTATSPRPTISRPEAGNAPGQSAARWVSVLVTCSSPGTTSGRGQRTQSRQQPPARFRPARIRQPTTIELPITGSSINIGSKSLLTTVGGTFGSDANGIMRIEADAGDVVDTAAAELVLHIQHRQSSYDYITQRLLHFPTTRDENNHITGITLFDRTPAVPNDDNSFDSSRSIQGRTKTGEPVSRPSSPRWTQARIAKS